MPFQWGCDQMFKTRTDLDADFQRSGIYNTHFI